jgi:hypothetical protein
VVGADEPDPGPDELPSGADDDEPGLSDEEVPELGEPLEITLTSNFIDPIPELCMASASW